MRIVWLVLDNFLLHATKLINEASVHHLCQFQCSRCFWWGYAQCSGPAFRQNGSIWLSLSLFTIMGDDDVIIIWNVCYIPNLEFYSVSILVDWRNLTNLQFAIEQDFLWREYFEFLLLNYENCWQKLKNLEQLFQQTCINYQSKWGLY